MSSNDANSMETALQCVRCQYDLTGLAPEGSCPECGMSIAYSRSMFRRAGAPSRSVRSMKSLLGMTLISTCVGVPVVIMFAAYSFMNTWLLPGGRLMLFGVFMALAAIGMIIPLVTIFLVPKETRKEKMLFASLIWLAAGLSGIAFGGMFFKPEPNAIVVLGMGIATIACVLNLTRANRAVGNVIPDWTGLGAARQKKEPLLVAIVLIMCGRLLSMKGLISLNTNDSILQFWGSLALFGLEVLLVIGGFYLVTNRLWLALKLFKSIQQGPRSHS